MQDREKKLADATVDAGIEAAHACEKYPPFNSRHEGYAVILEELDELWLEAKKKNPDKDLLRYEAIQVAAMALRFAAELGDGKEK